MREHYGDDRLGVVPRPAEGIEVNKRRVSLTVVVPDMHREIDPFPVALLPSDGEVK